MDPDTAQHHARAYNLTAAAVLDWWGALPPAVQPVIARAFRLGIAPRDAQAYRLYEQGMESFAAFVASQAVEGMEVVA